MDPNRLKALPLFADLSDEQVRTISPFAGELSVEAGKRLVNEGDYSTELIAIEEGEAEVTKDGATIATLGPGDFFGETGVVENERRNATVVAKTPMRLVTLSNWELRRLEKSSPEAIEKINQVIDQRRDANA